MQYPTKILLPLLFALVVIPTSGSSQDRTVQNNILVSSADPRLAIRIDAPFKYVGVHDFDIRGIAGGTRHVFVDSKNQQISRMFIVQLEGFYPDNDGIYRYDLTGSPEVAGYRWRSNGYTFNLATTRRDSPGNESALTAEYLSGLGYESPELILMWRSLTVVNEARTHEAILFLLEAGEPHGLQMSDLIQDDNDTPRWREIQKRMEQDFYELVSLSSLDENGQAKGDWAKIPPIIMGVPEPKN
jgi:hypothetical protein